MTFAIFVGRLMRRFVCTRHGIGSCEWLLALLLISNGLAAGMSSGPCRILPGTGSPNGKFALAVCKLEKKDWRTNSDGLTLDESLFIIGLKPRGTLQEISENYRRPSSASWPKYRAIWSADSSHLAAIVRFRPNSDLTGYSLTNGQWARLNLPSFDPIEDMKTVLKREEPITGESEIVTAKWHGIRELRVQAEAYIKTEPTAEMRVTYAYQVGARRMETQGCRQAHAKRIASAH
jgi:hypothetical protein